MNANIRDTFADEWRVQRFDTQDGLPHNTITAITQDQFGFVWVGTPNGLVRYDGYQFHPFVDPQPNGLSSFIKTLYTDQLGMVWVGTEQDLFVINAKTLNPIPVSFKPTRSIGIQFLAGDDRGIVYASTATGVYHCSISTMICELKPVLQSGLNNETDYIVHISKPYQNTLYGFTQSNKFVTYDPKNGSWNVLDHVESLASADVFDIGDGDFLYLKDENVIARFNIRTRLFLPIQSVQQKPPKSTIAVANGRLYRWDSDTGSPIRMRIVKDANAVLQNHVRSLYCTKNNFCWIGTLNGLYSYSSRNSPFHSFSTRKTDISIMRRMEVSAIEHDGSDIIIGTLGGGVYRFEDQVTLSELKSNQAKTAEIIWDLTQSPNGDTWIGADNGLFHVPKNAMLYSAITQPNASTSQAVNQIEIVNDSTIIVASFAGLWLFDTKRFRWIRSLNTAVDPSQRIVVQSITKIDQNRFLLGTFSNEVLAWNNRETLLTKVFTAPPHLPKSSEGYWVVYRDTLGTLWVGSDAGLTVISTDGSINHINSNNGLSGNIVYAILPDSRGRLWISTERGMSVIIPKHNSEKFVTRSFHTSDGLPIHEFNRRAAFTSLDGQLWFGGIEGLTWFDPESVELESAMPKVLVYQAEIRGINGNRQLNAGKIDSIQLNPYESSLILGFGSIGLYSQKSSFRYLLSDVDFDTIRAGTTRSATYTNLRPGSYTFQVWASDEYGRWPKEGTSISIFVKAAFWQTPSFIVLVIVIVLVVLGYAYRLRFKRLLALERVRLSIAADLHDQVGSGLSSLAMMSELGAGSTEQDQTSLLKTISSSARNMAHELREIVWYTNPRFDNLSQVVERMRDLPYQFVPGCCLDLRFQDEIPHTPLSPDFRRDWMMTFREILHNIAKHAHAQNLRIELSIDHKQLVLQVEDDGCGFDLSKQSNGMGLQNIKDRTARLRGTAKWISTPEKGTIVQISVPLP